MTMTSKDDPLYKVLCRIAEACERMADRDRDDAWLDRLELSGLVARVARLERAGKRPATGEQPKED